MDKISFKRVISLGGALAAALVAPSLSLACGGFFCSFAPINQAGEQIVFKQQSNDRITALVQIQYAGNAEDFSWVVPVPGNPTFQIGSDLIFSPLELATRPQFNLTTEGEACPIPSRSGSGDQITGDTSVPEESANDGVTVIQSTNVGPFEVEVIEGPSAEAMATWLESNGYDIGDRGAELLAPYIEMGMNFVALKLQQDQDVGDLQPIMMEYDSVQPMIPIILTGIAAQDDMGVLTWVLGPERAVPTNYLHVTPNYTMLDWYNGSQVAYSSYQGLITDAMDEAGGHGFATDYASADHNILEQLPTVEQFEAELERLNAIQSDDAFVASLVTSRLFGQNQVLAILQRHLPLDEQFNVNVYASEFEINTVFSEEELSAARPSIAEELQSKVVGPLEATLAIFDGDDYMTRLYTTLSAHEMTVDPIFAYNEQMPDQARERNATLSQSCLNGTTHWSLTLGEGTGRDGEVVIEATGQPPTRFNVPTPQITQLNVATAEQTSADAAPMLDTDNSFEVAQVQTTPDERNSNDDNDLFSGSAPWAFLLGGLLFFRRRKIAA